MGNFDKSSSKKMDDSIKLRFYDSFFKNVDHVYLTVSLSGKLLYCSDSVKNFGRYEAKKEIGSNISKYFVKKSDIEKVFLLIDKAKKEKSQINYEFLYKPKTGKSFFAEIMIFPFYVDGILKGFNGIIVNVDEIKKQIKKIESKLKENEQEFSYITSNIQDIIIRTDLNGNYTYISPSHKRILGMGQEILGKNCFEFIHPDDKKNVLDVFTKIVKTGKQGKVEYRFLHPNKNYIWLESIGIRYIRENKSSILISTRDISVRKKMENELNKAKEHFKMLFENSCDAIFIMKKNKFIDCNKKVEEIFETNKKKILNKSPLFFSPTKQSDGKNSKDKITSYINKTLKGNPQQFEWIHKTYNGKIIECEIKLNKIIINDDIFIQAILRDVTEKKESERKLIASEKKYSQIVNIMPDIIIRFNKKGQYLEVLASSEEKLGFRKGNIVNKTIKDIFPKEQSSLIMKCIKKTLLTKKLQIVEYQLEVTAKKLYFEARILPTEKEEVIALVRDITEKKEIEIKIKENEEKFRKYLDNSPISIFVANEKGYYEYVNKKATDLLKYSLEEFKKMNIRDIIFKEDLKEIMDGFKILIETGKLQSEYTLKTKDNNKIHVKLTGIKMPDNKVMALCEDITDKKIIEENLKEQVEMLQRFKDVTVDQVLKMKTIEQENNELKKKFKNKKNE